MTLKSHDLFISQDRLASALETNYSGWLRLKYRDWLEARYYPENTCNNPSGRWEETEPGMEHNKNENGAYSYQLKIYLTIHWI